MADSGARRDNYRIAFVPEATPGTYITTAARFLQCTGRVKPIDEYADAPANDGNIGAVIKDFIRRHWEAELDVVVTDPKTEDFPTLALLLLASGWRSVYSGSTLTLTPTDLPIAGFPDYTGASRSPCSASLTEIQLDNQAADRRARIAGATIAGGLSVLRSKQIMYKAKVKGLAVSDNVYEVGTDYSAVGAVSSAEGAFGVPFTGSVVATITDEAGSPSSIALVDWDGLDIDFAATHELLIGAVSGFDIAPVFHNAPMTATLKIAMSRAIDALWWPRVKTGRARLDITMTQTFASGATLVVDIPCAQVLNTSISADNGKQMAEVEIGIARPNFGNTDSPITISITHDT